MSKSRPHRIRASGEHFNYAKRLGKGEASDGLEVIFKEHRDCERVKDRCELELQELTAKRDEAREQASAAELEAATLNTALSDATDAKTKARAAQYHAQRRSRLWRVLFWIQLIAWPTVLAVLDAVL